MRHEGCPTWCVAAHGIQLGEEDWVHLGEPVSIGEDATARLCQSIDPATGQTDGVVVLVGEREYSTSELADLATRLLLLATADAQSSDVS